MLQYWQLHKRQVPSCFITCIVSQITSTKGIKTFMLIQFVTGIDIKETRFGAIQKICIFQPLVYKPLRPKYSLFQTKSFTFDNGSAKEFSNLLVCTIVWQEKCIEASVCCW